MKNYNLSLILAMFLTTVTPVLAQEDIDAPTPVRNTTGEGTDRAPKAEAPKAELARALTDEDDDDLELQFIGKDYAPNYGAVGAMLGGDARQPFPSFGGQLGYHGIGKTARLGLNWGGDGKPGNDAVQLKADALGVMLNDKHVTRPRATVGLNGRFIYGSGDLTSDGAPKDAAGKEVDASNPYLLNSVVTFNGLVPLLVSPGTRCAGYGGLGAGMTQSNYIRAATPEGKTTTDAIGGAISFGGFCQVGALKAMTHNHVIFNLKDGSNPDRTAYTTMGTIGALYQFNQNFALGAHGAIDTDKRTGKDFFDNYKAELYGDIVLTFGHDKGISKRRPAEEETSRSVE